jgi:hypothetical protein
MKKYRKKLDPMDDKGQTTVLFSVLLLLVVVVGLTILQTGHGVVQRVRHRQLSDSAVLAIATSYMNQVHYLYQLSLVNHYISLTHATGEAMAIIHEAGAYVHQEAAGYDSTSAYFSSSDFQQKVSNFKTYVDDITDQPLSPEVLPIDFQNDASALILRSAIKAGENTIDANQTFFGGLFQQLEYTMLPDAIFWSDDVVGNISEGFLIITEMPSPRFFFLNLFPYSAIHRRGRVVSASYAGRISELFSAAEASKEAWHELCNEMKEINEINTNRVLEMKELNPGERPEELEALTNLWEALLNDYIQWTEAMANNELFSLYSLHLHAPANVPAFSTLLRGQGELKEKLITIAEQKGIDVTNEEQMRALLADSLRLKDFFAESSIEQSVTSFQDRFLDMTQTINSNPTVSQNEVDDLLELLEAFEFKVLFPDQSLSSILSAIAQSLGSELESTDQIKVESLKDFFQELSENIFLLFRSTQFFADRWVSMSPSNIGTISEPSSSFYESARDFFDVSLQRLESN